MSEWGGRGWDGWLSAGGMRVLRHQLQRGLVDLNVTVVTGVGFSQKAASLSLPPFQPGTPLTFKLVGPIMNARVAL